MTRVLPAFVVALLAIAPSASGGVGADAPGWTARAEILARSGADASGRDRATSGPAASSQERAPRVRYVAPLPAQACVPVVLEWATELITRDRIVDARALARRTFARRCVASRGAEDPDAAA